MAKTVKSSSNAIAIAPTILFLFCTVSGGKSCDLGISLLKPINIGRVLIKNFDNFSLIDVYANNKECKIALFGKYYIVIFYIPLI